MMDLSKRLAKLEDVAFAADHHAVRQFAIEAPADLPESVAVAFLRSCGHEICDEDLILIFVGSEDERSEGMPLKDVTSRLTTPVTLAASSLHMQPGQV